MANYIWELSFFGDTLIGIHRNETIAYPNYDKQNNYIIVRLMHGIPAEKGLVFNRTWRLLSG